MPIPEARVQQEKRPRSTGRQGARGRRDETHQSLRLRPNSDGRASSRTRPRLCAGVGPGARRILSLPITQVGTTPFPRSGLGARNDSLRHQKKGRCSLTSRLSSQTTSASKASGVGCGPTQPRTRHGSEALCRWSALSGFCNGPHPPLYGSDVRNVLLSTALALRDDFLIAALLGWPSRGVLKAFPEQGQREGPRRYAQR